MRNFKIDLLRGTAILLVLLHHFAIAYYLPPALRPLTRNGNYGVTIFFAVSGFLITTNALSRWGNLRDISLRGFYGLRIARIIPCLLLLLVLADLLTATGLPIFANTAENGAPVSIFLVNAAALTFSMNVLLAHDGWVNYPLGVLWSLGVEEVFYLTFPLICLALRRDLFTATLWLLVILISPIYRFAHQDDEAGFLYAYFACFDAIAIGCCTALLARKPAFALITARPTQITIIAAMASLYLWRSIADTNVYGTTLMALGTAILLLAARQNPPLARTPALSLLAWFGRHSYELYLFHLLILGLLRSAFPPATASGPGIALLLSAFLLGSTLTSAVLARLYAEPLNSSIRNSLKAGHLKSAAPLGNE